MYKSYFYRLIIVILITTFIVNCGGTNTTPEAVKPELIGLADFHTHQFGYLGFGGNILSHSINPSEVCRSVPSSDKTTMRMVDLIRDGLFAEANQQLDWQASEWIQKT